LCSPSGGSADAEIAEALALFAASSAGGENGIERSEDAGVIEILGIELVAVEQLDIFLGKWPGLGDGGESGRHAPK
jgi:hypothetical protein